MLHLPAFLCGNHLIINDDSFLNPSDSMYEHQDLNLIKRIWEIDYYNHCISNNQTQQSRTLDQTLGEEKSGSSFSDIYPNSDEFCSGSDDEDSYEESTTSDVPLSLNSKEEFMHDALFHCVRKDNEQTPCKSTNYNFERNQNKMQSHVVNGILNIISPRSTRRQMTKSNKICHYYILGNCRNGKSCTKRHTFKIVGRRVKFLRNDNIYVSKIRSIKNFHQQGVLLVEDQSQLFTIFKTEIIEII